MTLSVIVIALNEAATIGRCLASVTWADERIVLDGGSRDDTAAIARSHGAIVEIAADWPGFGPQKNRALALAHGDWVLALDADEWVTPALRDALAAALRTPGAASAFRLPRQSSYCGRPMRHSGWWPDHVVRLFRRGQARFSDDLVHEHLQVPGEIVTLQTPLQHEAIRDPADALHKANAYSSAGAEMLHRQGRRASLVSAIGHGLWAFLRTYVLRAGFLDGREGFMLAVSNAEGAYYRYVKLMLLTEASAAARDATVRRDHEADPRA